jgi:hypothetical protein
MREMRRVWFQAQSVHIVFRKLAVAALLLLNIVKAHWPDDP